MLWSGKSLRLNWFALRELTFPSIWTVQPRSDCPASARQLSDLGWTVQILETLLSNYFPAAWNYYSPLKQLCFICHHMNFSEKGPRLTLSRLADSCFIFLLSAYLLFKLWIKVAILFFGIHEQKYFWKLENSNKMISFQMLRPKEPETLTLRKCSFKICQIY